MDKPTLKDRLQTSSSWLTTEAFDEIERLEGIIEQVRKNLTWIRATEKDVVLLSELSRIEHDDREKERDEVARMCIEGYGGGELSMVEIVNAACKRIEEAP